MALGAATRNQGDRDVGVAGPPQAVAVTASPMTYANQSGQVERLYITTAAASTTSVARAGVSLGSVVAPAATNLPMVVDVPPGASVVITYTVAPTAIVRDVM